MAARSLNVLREQARGCRNCPLWARATQTVFGEGAAHAAILLVGEQPGDQEDRQGRPFVGPAGHLLETALARAGIDRRQTYVTNAVKHFKWVAADQLRRPRSAAESAGRKQQAKGHAVPGEGRGKRRIHQKPSTTEVRACQPWLLAEIEAVGPRVIVCLGATAAQSLLGGGFRVTQGRGQPLPSPYGAPIVATVHPASILRGAPDEREAALARFVGDLRAAADLAGAPSVRSSGPLDRRPAIRPARPEGEAGPTSGAKTTRVDEDRKRRPGVASRPDRRPAIKRTANGNGRLARRALP